MKKMLNKAMKKLTAEEVIKELGYEEVLNEHIPTNEYTSLEEFKSKTFGTSLSVLFKEGHQIGYCVLNGKDVIKQDQTVKFDPVELKVQNLKSELITIPLS